MLTVALCASAISSSAVTALVPVAILKNGGSVTLLSAALAVYSVVYGLTVLPAGVISDRFPRKRLLTVALMMSGVGHVGLGITLTLGGRSPAALLVVLAVVGTAGGLALPQARSLIPDFVNRDELVAINGYLRTILTIIGITTPLAVTVAFRVIGTTTIPFLSASILVLAVLAARRLGDTSPSASRHDGFWRGALEGVRHIHRTRWLWSGLLFSLALATCVDAFVKVAGPVQAAATSFGAQAWPILVSSLALGQCVANLRLRSHRGTPSPISMYVPTMGAALALAGFAMADSLWMMCAAFVLYSFSFSTFDTLWHSRLQLSTPRNLLGRVLSVDEFCITAFRPLGLIGGGAALTALGVGVTGLMAAVLVLVLTTVALVTIAACRTSPAERPVDGITT
ncbi:MFS transporter [Nonomuraea turkmeniaca]|nr:MFS transporter [Nonomuraea turkmeniaca]